MKKETHEIPTRMPEDLSGLLKSEKVLIRPKEAQQGKLN